MTTFSNSSRIIRHFLKADGNYCSFGPVSQAPKRVHIRCVLDRPLGYRSPITTKKKLYFFLSFARYT